MRTEWFLGGWFGTPRRRRGRVAPTAGSSPGFPRGAPLELAPGGHGELHWPVAASGNWYDVVVTAAGMPFFHRFAGRVETGAPATTDPALGDRAPARR